MKIYIIFVSGCQKNKVIPGCFLVLILSVVGLIVYFGLLASKFFKAYETLISYM